MQVMAAGQPLPVLPPIGDRLNFHQTHEGAAEAAGAGITKTEGDVGNALVGLNKKMASGIETHLGDHLAVTDTCLCEMTLQ